MNNINNSLNGLNNDSETIKGKNEFGFNNLQNEDNYSIVDQFMQDLKNNPNYFDDNIDQFV